MCHHNCLDCVEAAGSVCIIKQEKERGYCDGDCCFCDNHCNSFYKIFGRGET